jgi:hypothetical protein
MNIIEAFRSITHEHEMYVSGDERYVFSFKESDNAFGKSTIMFRAFCERIGASCFLSNKWEVRYKKKKTRKMQTCFIVTSEGFPSYAMTKLMTNGTKVILEWEELVTEE